MDRKTHPNFAKSSNLIFISFGFGLISLFITRDELVTAELKGVAITTMLFILGLALLVRQGYHWIKYLLLVLTVIGLVSVPSTVTSLLERSILGFLGLIQTLLQVWAMIILFTIPRATDMDATNSKVD